MAKFRNPEENANPITIEAADANGYDLLGAGWLITLNPGASAMFYLPEQPENIDATHKGHQGHRDAGAGPGVSHRDGMSREKTVDRRQ